MKQNILMPIMIFMTRFYHSSTISGNLFSFLKTLFPAILAGILLVMNSCEDEGTIIGKNILPGKDFVNMSSTDTLSVRSYTMYTDSLDSGNPSYAFLGEIYDPYFGTTTTEFVSQIRMFSEWVEGTYTVDSVKLLLTFSNVSGDVSAGHILRMSEIAEQIYTDSAYYSSQPVNLTGFSVEVPLPELRADTINNIILDLPPSFGEYIIRDTSRLFHSDDEPDFRSYFKGLYFQLRSAGNPVFITLSLEPPGDFEYYKHQLSIYMHNPDAVKSVLTFNIDAKTKNAAFNKFTHDFSTADPDKRIIHVNDGVKDTLTYIQCLNGLYTKLSVPGLKEIKEDPSLDGIYINKARISCPVHYDGGSYIGSAFPALLYMGYYNKAGERYLVPDYYVNALFFDGVIDTTAGNYSFNIASYVQLFLDDSTDTYRPDFQLALPEGSLQNAILKANNSANPIKFELTYTRF